MRPIYGLLFLLLLGFSRSSCRKSNTALPPAPAPADTFRAAAPITAQALCDYQLDEAALTATGWTKTFEDNFDSDLGKWKIWTGGAFNNELQYYQAANLQVSNGQLAITARSETASGPTFPGASTQKTFFFTSGRIESKTTVSANPATPRVRIAARIKLPQGFGMWPAFWSYDRPWPTQGEIDILEARGHEPTQYQTNYFYGYASDRNLVRNASAHITASEDLTRCYHVYELVWAQNSLTSYLDGQQIEIKTSGGYIPDMFGKTQRLTLNLAVGGTFFSNLNPAQIVTGTLYVDWVKVFTSN